MFMITIKGGCCCLLVVVVVVVVLLLLLLLLLYHCCMIREWRAVDEWEGFTLYQKDPFTFSGGNGNQECMFMVKGTFVEAIKVNITFVGDPVMST
jgi:hypothetical protein